MFAAEDCRRAVSGDKAPGEPCVIDGECANLGHCAYTGTTCPGVCAPAAAPGQSCETDTDCAPAPGGIARCIYQDPTTGSVCEQRSVGAAAGAGQPCGLLGGQTVPCQGNLWCRATGGAGTCEAFIRTGSPCVNIDDACEHGSFCAGPTGQMTCQKVELLRQAGADCTASPTGPWRRCDVYGGFTCVNGVCEAMGDGRNGARCDNTDAGDLVPCDEGFYCATDDTCRPVAVAGGACDSDQGCPSGTCDQANGVCAAEFCPAL
jgi:hypothetical protein